MDSFVWPRLYLSRGKAKRGAYGRRPAMMHEGVDERAGILCDCIIGCYGGAKSDNLARGAFQSHRTRSEGYVDRPYTRI